MRARKLAERGHERLFFYLDVELPCVPRVGELVVWAPGCEGTVRSVRVLASSACTWRTFPREGAPLVEVWLTDRCEIDDDDLAATLLERDGWKKTARISRAPETTE